MTEHYRALNAIPGGIAVDNLNKSWDAYTRGMWPYSQYHSSIEPRVWWNGLRKEPSGFILAVNLQLYFTSGCPLILTVVLGRVHFLPHSKLDGRGAHGFSCVIYQ